VCSELLSMQLNGAEQIIPEMLTGLSQLTKQKFLNYSSLQIHAETVQKGLSDPTHCVHFQLIRHPLQTGGKSESRGHGTNWPDSFR
jgi:hypothetical protein